MGYGRGLGVVKPEEGTVAHGTGSAWIIFGSSVRLVGLGFQGFRVLGC